jgi:membrane-associated protease RseP (regulator of RpoE activity)
MLLLLLLGVATAVALATNSLPVLLFILGIVFMIMLHEGGHYVVAKRMGMKVTQFFFGFGPRLWSFRKGETEYGVKALPFGGYVKIIGMSNVERDVDPADEPRTYRQQSFGKRVAVAVAGVVTHFLLAFVVLTLVWSVVGVPNRDKATLEIASITADSAAQRGGFRVGDRLVSIDGRPVSRWEDLPPYVQQKAGQRVTFVVERHGRQVTLTAVPTEEDRDGKKVGFLGVGPSAQIERVGPVAAMGRSAEGVGRLTVGTVGALGSIFSPKSLGNYADQVAGEKKSPKEEANRPVSLVGAARLADQAAESGVFLVLELFVVLNIFVAVLNMIPLLPFDGGHVAVAVYERIRSRKGQRYRADVSKMTPVAVAVIGFFLIFGMTTIWLDIVRPLANPFR